MKYLLSLFINGILLIHTTAQNVGIGTTTPIAKLDVNATEDITTRFNSTSNQMFVGFYENSSIRGYVGSYTGGAEDFDIGTGSANINGKMHFTIQGAPKMTIANSGNIGIGNTNPTERLHISGNINTTGEIKPDGVAGQVRQVLTSNGNGTMLWANAETSGNGNGGWGDCSIFTIDSYQPIANPNGNPNDNLGISSSISGGYAIVGSHNDDVGFTDNGSALIYKFNDLTNKWESQGKILNINPANSDNFGTSVAISGNYAVVGAYRDDEGGFTDNGSATIFLRNTATGIWEPISKLTNQNPSNGEYFGWSVAISGDYLLIGALDDNEGGLTNCGSASVYKRNTNTGVWEFQVKLLNPSAATNDQFGFSVSINGDNLIVGSAYDDENSKTNNGSATIFKRNTGTGNWEMQVKLSDPTSDNNDFFGYSVGIFNDVAVVGSYLDDENGFVDNGSATLFKRNTVTGVWENQGKLTNENGNDDDWFGSSVSINSEFIFIGTPNDDFSGIPNLGSITIFRRYENVWVNLQKFSMPNKISESTFGRSVCIDPSGLQFIIGAPGVSIGRGLAYFGKVKQ